VAALSISLHCLVKPKWQSAVSRFRLSIKIWPARDDSILVLRRAGGGTSAGDLDLSEAWEFSY
jgi:hypothetical protein